MRTLKHRAGEIGQKYAGHSCRGGSDGEEGGGAGGVVLMVKVVC